MVNQILAQKLSYRYLNVNEDKSHRDPVTVLLDHHSVIQNPIVKTIERDYGNIEILRFIDTPDIEHKRRTREAREAYANLIDSEAFQVHDTIRRFTKWLERATETRRFLVAHNDEKQIYWEATNRYISNRNVSQVSYLLELLQWANEKPIMVTFTYDPEYTSRTESWENSADDFNRFITRLNHEKFRDAKTFFRAHWKISLSQYDEESGPELLELINADNEEMLRQSVKIEYVRILEAQHDISGKNYGYCHIHALMFGEFEYLYWNGNFEEYKKFRAGESVKKSLMTFWRKGFVSTNKAKSGDKIRNQYNYLMKYVRKTWGQWDDPAWIGKAMLWDYNKRTFDKSKGFEDYVRDRYENHIRALGSKPDSLSLDEIVKFYPSIIDMPETYANYSDLPIEVRQTLDNKAHAYKTIRDPPIPDNIVQDFNNAIENYSTDIEIPEWRDYHKKSDYILDGMAIGHKPDRKTKPSKRKSIYIRIIETSKPDLSNPMYDIADNPNGNYARALIDMRIEKQNQEWLRELEQERIRDKLNEM